MSLRGGRLGGEFTVSPDVWRCVHRSGRVEVGRYQEDDMAENDALYYKYWGKARTDDEREYRCHLLPYHCLDVAAVGIEWLRQDRALLRRFQNALRAPDEQVVVRWVGAMLAIHDLGKFDIRFQMKVPVIVRDLWPETIDGGVEYLTQGDIKDYRHDLAGYGAFWRHLAQVTGGGELSGQWTEHWQAWVAAVTGHHGVLPMANAWKAPLVETGVKKHDSEARQAWLSAIAGIMETGSWDGGVPPACDADAQAIIAGFCSVADWVASNDEFVTWKRDVGPLQDYLDEARERYRSADILRRFGVIPTGIVSYGGVERLLDGHSARQVQTVVDTIELGGGLYIVEATTGSGKTEAALALAWRLLAAGEADSIVFALPTQATANAMLKRLERIAPLIFKGGNANIVLAHGKAGFNRDFANLKAVALQARDASADEGAAQCAQWISSSRKRVFLGQVGVCTIDQVLLSVLPVRYNGVRALGVAKSVLIVDEVHAYDRYMYGLLDRVVRRQRSAGGSVILLSATLPAKQKSALLGAWGQTADFGDQSCGAYPLVTAARAQGPVVLTTVDAGNRPPERIVQVKRVCVPDMEPDEETIGRIVEAASAGAMVGVVCNMVATAQRIARALRDGGVVFVDIFHSRYRFKDRQTKELTALETYGRNARRSGGRVLVATQVIEQSVDLDFDWMVTQLCPIDLLFQRMGRLHRHCRPRPPGYERPACRVLVAEGDSFGAHEAVYADTRALWRTRELLSTCDDSLSFPEAYREGIEAVYGGGAHHNEPDSVIGKACAYECEQRNLWDQAQALAGGGANPFPDTSDTATSLTRGKAMGLNLVLVRAGSPNEFLDGEPVPNVADYAVDEAISLNTVTVPASWRGWLPPPVDGRATMPMALEGDSWVWSSGGSTVRYSTDYGLELVKGGGEQ